MNDDIVQYYDSIMKHYASYHNHKELSAWAALVFYVVFCAIVASSSFRVQEVSQQSSYTNIIFEVLLSISVVIAWFILRYYISNQLKLKDLGGTYVAAALFLMNEVMQLTEKVDKSEYLKIANSSDTENQSSRVLPKRFLQEADKFDKPGRGAHITKFSIHFLLAVTLAAIVLLQASKFFKFASLQ